jgi:A/G-specific adenine glycosylase
LTDYLWIEAEGYCWLKKRDASGIWKGLYEFPVVETPSDPLIMPFSDWFYRPEELDILKIQTFKHQLTHRTIYARLWHISTSLNNIVQKKEYIKIKTESLEKYPVHRLMLKFIEKKSKTIKSND